MTSNGSPMDGSIGTGSQRPRPAKVFNVREKRGTIVASERLPALVRRDLQSKRKASVRASTCVFVYTRFSTDGQEVKSEDRQKDEVCAYVLRRGETADRKNMFGDRGESGTGMLNRPGLLTMMARVRAERPAYVVVEDLDRLSRKLPDLLAIYYELQSLGVDLHDIQSGRLDLIHVVIRGYMAEEGRIRFLSMAKAGKDKAIRDGRLMSRPAFGYRCDPNESGVHHVHPEDAETVRWIIESVASGMSANAVAKDLTRRNVPPPAQARTLANGGKIATLKPWRGTAILKLIRNHLYVGLVSWNKSASVIDTVSRKRVGTQVRDESDMILVEHPDLAIVDEAVWIRANLRVAELTYGGQASVGRYLLTGRAACQCGAPLRAIASEYCTRYICTRHVEGKPGECDAVRQHRVDWIEAAVLQRLLAEVLHPTRLPRFVKRYAGQVARILKRDVTRAAVIRRRLEDINGLQLKSFEAFSLEAFGDKRLAANRKVLEAEAARLEAELEGLRNPADYDVRAAGLDAMYDGVAEIMGELPFRPQDADGIAVANLIRDVIAKVVVLQPVAGVTRLEITIDPLQNMRGTDEALDIAPEVLVASFDAEALKKAERLARRAGVGEPLAAESASGREDVSDAEWEQVAPILEGAKTGRTGESVDVRLLVDGMLCLARHPDATLAMIPARFGDPNVFRRAVMRLIYSRSWDEAVGVWSDADATCIAGARLERYDTTEFQRRPEGEAPDEVEAAQHIAMLRAIAAAESEDDPVRLRCDLVALVLEGQPITVSARKLGLSTSAANHYWTDYKDGGVDTLRRKGPAPTKAKLSPAQFARILKLANAGVDPSNPSRPATYASLSRACMDLFQVEFSVSGMRLLWWRNGLSLRKVVVKARRAAGIAAARPSTEPSRPKAARTPASAKERRALLSVARRAPPCPDDIG